MTVLRSREDLPRLPPAPQTPAKRKKHTPATTIAPPTPARTEDAPSVTARASAADLGFGAPPPGPDAPRRSPRLASRSPIVAAAERKSSATGMERDGGGDSGEREGRGKRGREVLEGASRSASRSEEEEGDRVDRVVDFDLNFPLAEFASGRGKGEGSGKAVDLTVSSSESKSDESEGELTRDPVSESRAVRRRVEVIEVESDDAEEVAEVLARGRRRYSSDEKGKAVLIAEDDATFAEKGRFFEFLGKGSSHAYDSEHEEEEEEVEKRQERRRYYSEEEKAKRGHVLDGDWLRLGGNEGGGEVGWNRMAEEAHKSDVIVRQKRTSEGFYASRNIEWIRTTRVEQPQLDHPANRRRESDRNKARELAPKFAFFKPEEEDESEGADSSDSLQDDPADWPGPFSTAAKIINDREKRLQNRQMGSASAKSKSSELKIEWVPSCKSRVGCLEHLVPSLRDLSVKVLSENASEIESLEGVPDELRRQLSWCICRTQKMDERVLDLFVGGSPTEIRVLDCSWATEEQFERIFKRANTDQLAVLQLDLCGRCLPDYVLSSTLARSPDNLPSLTAISLKGAYRLTDDGLNSLASSAPALSSIDLGQCSLITSKGIISLVEKLKLVLREVHLDNCHIDAMSILPALKSLKKLEALSVAGIESVTNKFVRGLVSVHSSNVKELVFTGCKQLTTTALKDIGVKCPHLCSLDLRDLSKLNDYALGYLANGCTLLRKLMLRNNSFSDKAIAVLLEASGGLLSELSLNNIKEVSNFTAQAIAIRCSLNLQILDFSFCRKMTDEGLGLIVDSCSYLRILKVFGCRQGHANSNVKIVGLEGSILQHLGMSGFSSAP